MQSLKAVLCDLDNTLIDFRKYKDKSIKAAIKSMISKGLTLSQEDGVNKVWQIYANRGWEIKDVFQILLEENTGNIDYSILSNGIKAYRTERNKHMKTYKGVKPTLRKLKERGLYLGIISDAPKLKAWMRLAYLGLDEFFDTVVAYEDTYEYKPSRKPFEKTLRDLAIEPTDAIFVGDNVSRDVVGANNMGMVSVYAKYGDPAPTIPSGAHYDLRSFEDLLKII